MGKKNSNLAALLGDGAATANLESRVTGHGKEQGPTLNTQEATNTKNGDEDREVSLFRKEEPKMTLEDELALPKSFAKAFRKNPDYEKANKTTTIVYSKILDRYKAIAKNLDVDTLVLVNNVLAEWYNKNLDSINKVVNRKSDIDAL